MKRHRTISVFAAAAAVIFWVAQPIISSADEFEHLGRSPAELDRLGLDAVTFDEPAAAGTAPKTLAIVDATLVLQEGETPTGVSSPVTSVNQPFVNGAGDPGFTGMAGDGFVWSGPGVLWVNSDGLPTVLTGAEFTMGIGDGNAFIYSPSIDAEDGVWTHLGKLARETEPAPGMPGFNSTFHSRPTMAPSGQPFWVAGHNDGAGGTTSQGRILYTTPDATPGNIAIIFKTGDVIDGQTIDDPGIDFDYDLSDNAAHHIHPLTMATGSSANDGFLYLDGSLVAREGEPNGSGVDNWDNFDFVSINNDGDSLFSGDTDGDVNSDEFIAHNLSIILREGDIVDGVTLQSGWTVRGVGINNRGHAIFGWGTTGTEHVFFACDASDLQGTGQLVLSTGDLVDLDGNGTGDATVTDAPAGLIHNFQLGDDGRFFMEVELDYGAGELEAIIGIELPSCGLFVDGFESGDTSRWHATVP
jgi:hypothetical protein